MTLSTITLSPGSSRTIKLAAVGGTPKVLPTPYWKGKTAPGLLAKLANQTIIISAQEHVPPDTYTLALGNQLLAVEITEPPFWAFGEVLPEEAP
jgi:hypothetical protein